ncbi:MAG: hypothetical protein IJE08_11345 [Clostridia bacterium]|nr:hypothetical protein [Clostridia bacterium]
MSKNRSQNILLAEIMVAVLFFALCSTVILEVFVTAKEYSGRAEAESEAMLIAQDLAEQFYAADDAEALLQEKGFIIQNDIWTAELNGYTLAVETAEESTEAGILRTAQISISLEEDMLAGLPVARYIPGGVSE